MTLLDVIKSLFMPPPDLTNARFWAPGGQEEYLHVESGDTYYVISQKAINNDSRLKIEDHTRTVVYTDCVNLYTLPYTQFHGETELGQPRFVKL